MSKARLVITAVVVEGRSQSEVARTYAYHHGMFGYVFVVASPYWARIGADGTFSIAGVPAGAGKLTVWNERSSPTTMDLTLPLAVPPKIGIEITMPRIPPHKNKLGKPYSGGSYG